jgi:hypothetical protein
VSGFAPGLVRPGVSLIILIIMSIAHCSISRGAVNIISYARIQSIG